MSYTSTAKLVFGFELTKEEESNDFDLQPGKLRDLTIAYSGDSRIGYTTPILGILLGKADEFNSPSTKVRNITEKDIEKLKEFCSGVHLKYRTPKLHLIVCTI